MRYISPSLERCDVKRSVPLFASVFLCGCGVSGCHPPAQPGAEGGNAPTRQLVTEAGYARLSTLCRSTEVVIYECPAPDQNVSVCATDQEVILRVRGPRDIEIKSNGTDGIAHIGGARGAGGGETNLRFSANGLEHIVYAAEAGHYTDVPGRRWSGWILIQGPKEISRFACPLSGEGQEIKQSRLKVFIAPETQEEFNGWLF